MGTAHLFRDAPEVIAFPAGSLIFQFGQPGKNMYMVIEGEVEMIVGNKVVDTVGSGAFIGEMALIDDSPRSASARAKSDVRVFPIDAEKFESLVKETPFFGLDVMRTLAQRLRHLDAMVSAAGSSARARKKAASRKTVARKKPSRKPSPRRKPTGRRRKKR